MFAPRYFPARYFAPRYWPPGAEKLLLDIYRVTLFVFQEFKVTLYADRATATTAQITRRLEVDAVLGIFKRVGMFILRRLGVTLER